MQDRFKLLVHAYWQINNYWQDCDRVILGVCSTKMLVGK